ncbi:hypothetical protein ASG88_20470 [Nocardioides sp. Soil777]|uniref:hypothetical protein n=1 Tax=Nocardioides sp. Soil777 TaxID=1736409 RepID=UPI000703514B|nr:hypothetical protein [Nocardioides sp. Soil777]KRF05875.1 hypothetical protein ASG88_20470 [Nocardioides sp. Soil777]
MEAWVDLYWLPLGAGGHVVRLNGRLYERLAARREHRPPLDLYHSGLMVGVDGVTYAVEMGPVWNVSDPHRGVLCEGPVASEQLGRFRAFRYEVRCWPGGRIPDIAEAVASPVRTTDDPAQVAAVLDVLAQVPPLTWGRDELHAGEMWNSNSVVSWALARSGHDTDALRPPAGGRAPGWDAGLHLAMRQRRTEGPLRR